MDLSASYTDPTWLRSALSPKPGPPLRHRCRSAGRSRGLYRFGDLWVGLAEGPEFDDYASGSGLYAEQALRRLSDRLRERRGKASG